MNKLLSVSLVCLLAACGSHSDGHRGAGFNGGPQNKAIVLTSGNNNDLAVPGGGPGVIIRLSADAGGSTLTGLANGPFGDGDLFWIRNDGASGSLTITDSDAGSVVAADQFLLPGSTSIVLTPHMAVQCERDATAGKFVCSTAALANSPVGEETITTGAAALTKSTTLLSTTGTQAYTLANGTFTGQRHSFEEVTAASTPLGTLTITTPAGTEFTTHVFTAIGQRLTLEWNGTGWHVIEKRRQGRQAVVIGTTVLTGFDMALGYDLSVTGTVHSTTTKGIPNGLVAGEIIYLDVLTAASTATGDISITAKTTVGVAATSWGATGTSIGSAGTVTTGTLGAIWDGAAWQVTVLTTATLAMNDNFAMMHDLLAA